MQSYLNHIPLLRLLIPYVIGVITAIYYHPNSTYLIPTFILTSLSLILCISIKKINTRYRIQWIIGLFIYLNLFLTGLSMTSLTYKNTKQTNALLTHPNNQLYAAEIIEAPQEKNRSIKAIIFIQKIKQHSQWLRGSGKAIVYLAKDSASKNLNLGDVILFSIPLKQVSPPKNPHEFDFRKYLGHHHIHQQAYLPRNQWRLIHKDTSQGIVKFATNSRRFLINRFEEKGIHNKELAVVSALILGFKEQLDPELKDAYASAGAMHILAVSGLHVGIIFLIFNYLFMFIETIPYGKIIKGILLMSILWAYALLTGLSPSVLRAVTMFSFIIAAKMTQMPSNFFNTLAASAFVLLLYNPLLIMEVGFQLSYLAVVGIVIIQPWLNDWFEPNNWLIKKVWEITSVSIAAQIATFPLGLLYFHQFPNYFMLSNLIVIPLTILILYLGILTLLLSDIPILGDILGTGLRSLIQFLNYSVQFIDSLPYSLSENIRFSHTDAWLIYLFIVSSILLIIYRKFNFICIAAACIIIFLLSNWCMNWQDLNQKQLIVYNTPKHSVINFISGKNNVLWLDSTLFNQPNKLLFHVQNNWINKGLDPVHFILNQYPIKTEAKKKQDAHLNYRNNHFKFYHLFIVKADHHTAINNYSPPLEMNLLIISSNCRLSLEQLLKQYHPKEIVLDASISPFESKQKKAAIEHKNIPCWSVFLDGVFIKNIK